MNKKLIIFTITAVLLIAGALAYTLAISSEDSTQPTNESAAASAASEVSAEAATPANQAMSSIQKGEYRAYSADAVAKTAGRKLLFFYASWCPQCRDLDASITAQGVPDNTTIFKVNYDSATDLRQKYGVTIQTTIVEIDDDGRELKKHVAYDHPDLAAVLKALE